MSLSFHLKELKHLMQQQANCKINDQLYFIGRFYDYPGDDGARKNEFFKLKGDICDPAGCLSELCIQLSIIMIGKQFFNNFMEYLYP